MLIITIVFFIESCSISCLNGGTCVGFNRCRCTPEYKGIFCEQAVCIPDCINNGVCVRPGVCYCPIGFYGQQCENGKFVVCFMSKGVLDHKSSINNHGKILQKIVEEPDMEMQM